MTSSDQITVTIVDDHPIYRDGLAAAVEGAEDLQLLAADPSIEEFDRRHLQPGVVLLDLHLPGITGSEGVEHVVGAGHRVLVVSAAATPDAVVDAMGAGAAGYLTKDARAADIVTAVRVVAAGGTYVTPTLAGYLLRDRNKKDRFSLTDRELEVLELVAEGETDQQIARTLTIEVTTVRSHLDRIRDKTGHRRRAQMTSYYRSMEGKKP